MTGSSIVPLTRRAVLPSHRFVSLRVLYQSDRLCWGGLVTKNIATKAAADLMSSACPGAIRYTISPLLDYITQYDAFKVSV